ncbi:hypothetical protein BX600DRAFT_444120 [Xylariales sp. PMI_506]|nr:hypothetical protein BX600DRAFT_444120 [Xylariales sp. PMI_506]
MAGGAAKGNGLDVTRKYREHMVDTGFIDVTERRGKMWGNNWHEDPVGRRLGSIGLISAHEVIEGMSMRLLHGGLGMQKEEVTKLKLSAQEDSRNTDIHYYWPI